jgi:hypothetical protein
MNNTELLFKKCPSLLRADEDALTLAISRMAVAHIMNGGEWRGWLETAVSYLESIS